MSIRNKLTAAFFLLLVVVGGAFFYTAVRIVTASWYQSKSQDNLLLAVNEADEVCNWIDRKSNEVAAMGRFDGFQSNSRERIRRTIERLRTPINGIIAENELFILDQNGQLIYGDSVQTSNNEQVILARDALDIVRDSKEVYVDGFLLSEDKHSSIVLICAPRWSAQGAFLGTLNARVDFNDSRAGRSLQILKPVHGTSFFLFDSLGTIFLSNTTGRVGEKEPQWADIRESGAIKGTISNDTLVITFAKVTRLPWWISVHQTRTQLDAEIREVEHNLLTVAGIGLLLSLMLTFLFSRSFSKPIVELIAKTAEMKEGTFIPLEHSVTGEIGQLVTAFNEMAVSLQKSHKKLSTLNELGDVIISDIRLNNILDHVCKRVKDVMEAESCSIYIVDPDNILRIKAATNLTEEEKSRLQFEIGKGITGTVFQQRKGMIVNDVAADPRSKFIPHRQGAMKLLSIPLLVHDEPLGVMNVHNKKESIDFTEDDLEILSTFSHQATISIENFRLFKEITKELQRSNELQAQLVQSEKLSAIGQLVAGVAHEINNPLGIIMGYAELMLEKTSDPGDVKSLKIIANATERAAGIVRNLLSFARKQEYNLVLVNINDIIESILELLDHQFKSHNIALSHDYGQNIGNIKGDVQQLQQVFLNLLTNAMQAMEGMKGGKIFIMTRKFGDTITVSIADNGPGIKSEHVSKIFEPFFTTKEIGKGTGLGLSICYGIIKELKGEITVTSAPGENTIFVVELPADLTEVNKIDERKPPESAAPIFMKCRVLVVDDEEDLQTLLQGILEAHGCQVRVAANGVAALEALKETAIDIIISDMKMPEMDGAEFYHRCVEEYPHYAKRFIFSSGDTVNEDIARFYASTGCEMIHKPYAAKQIIEKIRLVLAAENIVR